MKLNVESLEKARDEQAELLNKVGMACSKMSQKITEAIARLRTLLSNAEKGVKDAEENLSEAKHEVKKRSSQLAINYGLADSYVRSLTILNNELLEAEMEAKRLELEVETKEKYGILDQDNTAAKAVAARRKAGKLREDIRKCEADRRRVGEQIKDLERQYKESEANVSRCEGRLKSARENLAEKKKALAKGEKFWSGQLSMVNKVYAQVKSEFTALVKKVDHAKAMIRDYNGF